MELRPEEITKIIRSQIKNYENKLEVSETGIVILVVKAVSAIALSEEQKKKLTAKLEAITGKIIDLQCGIDTAALGGLRLSYDGKQVDGTVKTKLDAIGKLLKNTVL